MNECLKWMIIVALLMLALTSCKAHNKIFLLPDTTVDTVDLRPETGVR